MIKLNVKQKTFILNYHLEKNAKQLHECLEKDCDRNFKHKIVKIEIVKKYLVKINPIKYKSIKG